MDDRIVIGRFESRGRPPLGVVEAAACPRSDLGIVWLTCVRPHRAIGYVLHAHTPGAHFHAYDADLPESDSSMLLAKAVSLWAEANGRGEVSAEHAASSVRLGLTVVEGLRVDLTWEHGRDTVALAFRDLEPEHLGTATGLDGTERRFCPAPTHMAWATEPGRPERLVAAAADAYRRRPEPC